MAKIQHTNGTIARVPFEFGKESISFDSHTNPDLYSEVYSDPVAYSIVDGVLLKDGSPVVINDWCDDCKVLDAVLVSQPASVEQLQAAVKLLITKPGFTKG